jgi:hypothetical protein
MLIILLLPSAVIPFPTACLLLERSFRHSLFLFLPQNYFRIPYQLQISNDLNVQRYAIPLLMHCSVIRILSWTNLLAPSCLFLVISQDSKLASADTHPTLPPSHRFTHFVFIYFKNDVVITTEITLRWSPFADRKQTI